jgi:hypothetical protein
MSRVRRLELMCARVELGEVDGEPGQALVDPDLMTVVRRGVDDGRGHGWLRGMIRALGSAGAGSLLGVPS